MATTTYGDISQRTAAYAAVEMLAGQFHSSEWKAPACLAHRKDTVRRLRPVRMLLAGGLEARPSGLQRCPAPGFPTSWDGAQRRCGLTESSYHRTTMSLLRGSSERHDTSVKHTPLLPYE